MTPEQMWDAFIAHLNNVDPLIFVEAKKAKQVPHMNFLGSIDKYKRLFVEANTVE